MGGINNRLHIRIDSTSDSGIEFNFRFLNNDYYSWSKSVSSTYSNIICSIIFAKRILLKIKGNRKLLSYCGVNIYSSSSPVCIFPRIPAPRVLTYHLKSRNHCRGSSNSVKIRDNKKIDFFFKLELHFLKRKLISHWQID